MGLHIRQRYKDQVVYIAIFIPIQLNSTSSTISVIKHMNASRCFFCRGNDEKKDIIPKFKRKIICRKVSPLD